ncbi:3-oxoacid CoA-transferase subunit B [Amphibacillus sp. Q70]|uniref:3-oxoacid CoA-transferase subunit B n=1 Tax=Amphibacillus sp. Q70 TaxID=3453416 RepID=UPI003F845214
MDREQIRNYIAKRVAQELTNGDIVNLGIGLPTKVADFVPREIEVAFQSENGFIGLSPIVDSMERSIVNAGGQPVSIMPNGAFFDSSLSFGMIRGGHVDVTVLGALEVDRFGNIANYMIPGKMAPGMGGAMDLVVGAKKVIVAMQHTAKGSHKILNECQLPLTAKNAVDLIVTEMGVIEVKENQLILTELNPAFELKDVINATGAELTIEI